MSVGAGYLIIENTSGAKKIRITNAVGEVFYSTEIISDKLKINISSLKPGFYFLIADDQTLKIIKI